MAKPKPKQPRLLKPACGVPTWLLVCASACRGGGVLAAGAVIAIMFALVDMPTARRLETDRPAKTRRRSKQTEAQRNCAAGRRARNCRAADQEAGRSAVIAPPIADGFVSSFNGKDLTGCENPGQISGRLDCRERHLTGFGLPRNDQPPVYGARLFEGSFICAWRRGSASRAAQNRLPFAGWQSVRLRMPIWQRPPGKRSRRQPAFSGARQRHCLVWAYRCAGSTRPMVHVRSDRRGESFSRQSQWQDDDGCRGLKHVGGGPHCPGPARAVHAGIPQDRD